MYSLVNRFLLALMIFAALMALNIVLFKAIKRIKWIKVKSADPEMPMTLRNDSVSSTFAYTVFIILSLVITFIALLVMGVPVAHVFGFIASVSFVLGFASQELFKDIIAGISIAIGSYFTIGDLVTVSNIQGGSDVTGVVGSFNVLNTTIVSNQVPIVIPNSVMQNAVVHNMSVRSHAPIAFEFGVENTYQGGWDHVVFILNKAVTQVKDEYRIEKHHTFVSNATSTDATIIKTLVWLPSDFASSEANIGKVRTYLRQVLKSFDIQLSSRV